MIESHFKVIWACEAKAHRSIHQIEDAPIVRDLEIYIQSLVSDSSLCECSCVKYLILRILSPIMILPDLNMIISVKDTCVSDHKSFTMYF